ncbi:hypothetical protein AB0M95_17300 [Sphaerisporangium sp. NPDC051017]|uniref:hypothetical protein n=1 Tax=Sphaerisporangium sp. NPDC051017 TaxID=3154636 RepID=UPI00341887AC
MTEEAEPPSRTLSPGGVDAAAWAVAAVAGRRLAQATVEEFDLWMANSNAVLSLDPNW